MPAPTWDETDEIAAPKWDDTSAVAVRDYEAEGLPSNVSPHEAARLNLLSEQAAAQAEGERTDRALRGFDFMERGLVPPEVARSALAISTPSLPPGVAESVGNTASSFTSPLNIAIMAGTGAFSKIPGVVKGVAGGFAVDMGRHVPELARQAGETSVTGTPEQKQRAYTDLATTIGMTAAAAKGALPSRGIPAPIESSARVDLRDRPGVPPIIKPFEETVPFPKPDDAIDIEATVEAPKPAPKPEAPPIIAEAVKQAEDLGLTKSVEALKETESSAQKPVLSETPVVRENKATKLPDQPTVTNPAGVNAPPVVVEPMTPVERRNTIERSRERIEEGIPDELEMSKENQLKSLEFWNKQHAEIRREMETATEGERRKLARELHDVEMKLRELAVGKRQRIAEHEGFIYDENWKPEAPKPVQPEPPVEPAAAGEFTSPESRAAAATKTADQIRTELEAVRKQIAEFPKPKTMEDLTAKNQLVEKARVLDEALENAVGITQKSSMTAEQVAKAKAAAPKEVAAIEPAPPAPAETAPKAQGETAITDRLRELRQERSEILKSVGGNLNNAAYAKQIGGLAPTKIRYQAVSSEIKSLETGLKKLRGQPDVRIVPKTKGGSTTKPKGTGLLLSVYSDAKLVGEIGRDNLGKLYTVKDGKIAGDGFKTVTEARDALLKPETTKPTTPPAAEAKMQEQVSAVAKTEGARPAKEIKSELVQRLEEAIAKASKEDGTRAEGIPSKITIEIPGDGKFTIVNTPEAIATALKAAKGLATDSGRAPRTPTVGRAGDLQEQADFAVKTYGSPEKAYQAVKRQAAQLAEDSPEVGPLLERLFSQTKVSELEGKSSEAGYSARSQRRDIKQWQAEIERIGKLKKQTKEHKQKVEDFKESIAEAEKKAKIFERSEKEYQSQSEAARKDLEGKESVNTGSLGEAGMGGAKPGEFERGKGTPTAMKYKLIDQERQQRGLEPLTKGATVADQAVMDKAMAAVDADPSLPERLTRELNENPRVISDVENSVLLLRKIDLRFEYEKSAREAAQAFEDGRLDDMAEANARTADWSNKLSELESASRVSGSERGRALRSLRVMAYEDMTLAALEMKARADKGGAPITPEERTALQKVADDYKQKADTLEKHLAERDEKASKEAATQAVDEIVKKPTTKTAESTTSITDKIADKVEAGETNDIAGLVQQLARKFVAEGIREREALIDAVHGALKEVMPDITRRDTMDAISGYGKFKQLSKDDVSVQLRDLKGQMQQVGKLQDMQSGKAPQKTGVERRVPSDEERRLIQQVEEAKKKGGYKVTDPARQLKSALDAVKTRLKNTIADLEHQIATKTRTVKEKRGLNYDSEAKALQAKRDTLKAEFDEIFGKKELTDEQRVKMAMGAVEKSISEYERRIKAGELTTPKRLGKTPETPALAAARARRDALREQLQEFRDLANPKKTPEQIALQAFKTRTANRIAELRERIATGNFNPKPKRAVVPDAEANRLQAEKEQVVTEYERARQKKLWDDMSVFQKGKRTAANTYDAARMLLTTGEFSFVLRQGKFNFLSHPVRTAKVIGNAIRSMRSEATARAIDLEILNHPEAKNAHADKLALIDEHASLTRQEELMMGRWANVIPVVSAFNRAARVFLNKIRFDTWLAMRQSIARRGTVTPEEGRAIAAYVNESTGRGSLGKAGEPAAVLLSRVMFSPRYFASRLQYMAGHSMWGGSARSRAAIAMEYGRTLAGLGLYYSLLRFGLGLGDDDKTKVETDPRSSDFGKVKVGNTRIDPLAGVAQLATFGARTVTGETKTLKGDVSSIRNPGEGAPKAKKVPYGRDDWYDVAARFARSKAHPVPSKIANLFSGTDLAGNLVTPQGELVDLGAPITYIDIYQALKEQDLDDGVIMGLLAFLGEGLQTYKPKKK